jgi:hypothetical protein
MSMFTQLMNKNTAPVDGIDTSNYDFSNVAVAEGAYIENASVQLFEELYECSQVFLTADIMGQVKMLTEGADPQVLLEATVGDHFKSVGEKLKKFLAKIKAFIVNLKDHVVAVFANGETFVTKYGDKIEDAVKKDGKNYSFKAVQYDLVAGDDLINKVATHIEKQMAEYAGKLASVNSMSDMDKEKIKGTSTEDIQTEVSKVAGAKSASELKTALKKAYFVKGNAEAVEVKKLEAAEATKMIKFIKISKPAIQRVLSPYDAVAASVEVDIKVVDKIENAEVNTQVADKILTIIATYRTLLSTCGTVVSDTYQQAARTYTAILKGFFARKVKTGVSEGTEEDDEEYEDDDIFDDTTDVDEAACAEVPATEGVEPDDGSTDPVTESAIVGDSLIAQAAQYLL